MAPVDRAEHRQQRMRGAGTANVQTNFGFSFGALARPAKQASLPPRPTPRRTPVRTTPAHAAGSISRSRSASVQRSTGKRQKKSPATSLVTPALGKRKRASGSKLDTSAKPGEDSEDELSPDRDPGRAVGRAPSVAASKRASTPMAPILEDEDDVDELSMLDANAAVATVSVNRQSLTRSTASKSPALSLRTRTPAPRRSSPTLLTVNTPTPGPPRLQQAQLDEGAQDKEADELGSATVAALRTPGVTQLQNGGASDEDEIDELSPDHRNEGASKQVRPSPSKPTERSENTRIHTQDPETIPEVEAELPVVEKPKRGRSRKVVEDDGEELPVVDKAKRRRPRRVVEDEEDEASVVQTAKRGKPRRIFADGQDSEALAAMSIPRGRPKKTLESSDSPGERDGQELPEEPQTSHTQSIPSNKQREGHRDPIVEEEDHGEESDQDRQTRSVSRGFHTKRRPGRPSMRSREPETGEPPKKRRKRGPTQSIKVMRIPGFENRGFTVVDTVRDTVMQFCDMRIQQFADKIGKVKDAVEGKRLRQDMRTTILYRDHVEDGLLDLQAENDTCNAYLHDLRKLRLQNQKLQDEYFKNQNKREEIAIRDADVTETFLRDKKKMESENELSAALYDIQAAVENGRQRARQDGREDEGPEIPIKMLLEDTAANFGCLDGLLARVRGLNQALGMATGILEGQA
ncbi:hypothetical protein M011DRAFT_482854 [Sporormia fimetaria CBS 119925]|uniref:AT hook domain-containing protein n=1 Tax=Sporormia fimetaria CBS 119925 TaxID=1340428 RepID=A0A6A6VNA9_9PLEO|nr:hypothetical protein M011DRAFT_482854 [Sporormia fimetaria CBS 119925]